MSRIRSTVAGEAGAIQNSAGLLADLNSHPGEAMLEPTPSGGFRLVAVTQFFPVTDGTRPEAEVVGFEKRTFNLMLTGALQRVRCD